MGEPGDMRSGEPRVYVDHHWRAEPGKPPIVIHPAADTSFGAVQVNGIEQPVIAMRARCADFGLMFVVKAEELEVLGQAMLDRAAAMRKAADEQLAEVLARKPGA